jgi:hypothetical protein
MTPDSEALDQHEIAQSDSAAVRWAARLVYCAMAPLVVVGGLLVDRAVDLHSFLLRVVRTVYYAFGGDDTAVPEMIVTLLYAVSYLATVLAIFSATAP